MADDRKISIRWFLVLFGLLALASLVIVILFKEIHHLELLLLEKDVKELPEIPYELGLELFKTIFIGVAMGLLVEGYLRTFKGEPVKQLLEKTGIVHIYSSRKEAETRFKDLIENEKKVRNVYIMGISLREFLTEHAEMRMVWEAIRNRLNEEEGGANLWSDKRRLRVHLLLLDPRSSEGAFRYKVERPHLSDDPKDVLDGLKEVKHVQDKIYQGAESFLHVKLYEHCPFSFVFLTDTSAFVEQYYYKKEPQFEKGIKSVPFPLIEYAKDSSHYKEIQKSVEIIWDYASEELPSVGTAIPLKRAGIKNIFRLDNRSEQSNRQIECINKTESGTIDILSITGHHYVNDFNARSALQKAANKDGVTVRFALLNPVSQQAILRAIADKSVTDKMKGIIASYHWDIHKRSMLYWRVLDTIEKLKNWQDDEFKVEFRLYSCSTTSALLLTPESAFVGKYVYGRSKARQAQAELLSEYPMMEFCVNEIETKEKTGEVKEKPEMEILESTFRVIWDYYSLKYEDFKKINREEQFGINFNRLKEELNWASYDNPESP